ncbi:MAG: DNA repair protein RadC [Candidatus Krumholzibacteriia bacterium]
MFFINKIPNSGEVAATVRGAAPGSHRLLERVFTRGTASLSDRELLAAILGPGPGAEADGVAADLMALCGGLAGLAGAHPGVMTRIPGLGPARAIRITAALECGRRAFGQARPLGLKVSRPEDLHPLLRSEFRGLDRERFLALYLDTRHRILALETVSIGSLNLSVVHPREVFKLAVALSAAALIVAHNHPSGCAQPSGEDLELTGRLDRCGELLGVPLLDHLVAGAEEIISIREYGWPAGPAR